MSARGRPAEGGILTNVSPVLFWTVRNPGDNSPVTLCGECANTVLGVYRDLFEAFGIKTQDVSELAVEMSALAAMSGMPEPLTSSEAGKCGDCGKEVKEPVRTP